MRISIVMATYNGEKYIDEQLRSIFRQTYKPDEVIIRDDCSTDNTVQIIEDFIRKYQLEWRLIRGKKNIGFEKNFSEALKEASGDIIFFSDQDDVWGKNKIQVMTLIMNKHKQILCLNSGYNCINSKGEKKRIKSIPFTSNNGLIIGKVVRRNSISRFSAEEVLKYNISMGCTMAFRRELIADYQNNAGEVPHDWLINIIAATKNGLFFYNNPLIRYRLHNENTIGVDTAVVQEKRRRIELYNQMIKYYCAFSNKKIVQANDTLRDLSRQLCDFYKNRIRVLKGRKIPVSRYIMSIIKLKWMNIFIIRDYFFTLH